MTTTVATPAGALTFNGQESAAERQAAISRAYGVESAARAPAGLPANLHWNPTQRQLTGEEPTAAAPGTVGGKSAPPSPRALEAANKPQGAPSPERQADLERELQSKGLMRRADGTVHRDGQPDLETAERLTARYVQLRQSLKGAKAEQELRAVYEADMKRLLEGRPLSELELRIDAPKPGRKPTDKSDPAPTIPAYSDSWKAHIEDGEWVGLENLTTAHTSGYTLERYIDGQRLHISAIDLLRQARAAGITQAQVNAVLRQEAAANGWVKA